MKYDTKCKECGGLVEVSKKMTEDLPKCGMCFGDLEIVHNAPANVIFKGKWVDKSVRARRK